MALSWVKVGCFLIASVCTGVMVWWIVVMNARLKNRLLPWLQALHPLCSPCCPQGVLLDPLPALQSLLSCSVGAVSFVT